MLLSAVVRQLTAAGIVVHNRFGIGWAELWRAATEDVPVLRRQVAGILQTDFSG